MEEFALAQDRAKPLEQLIPGTEDYYYYHCLHHQHEGRFGKVEKLLKPWKRRHGETSRFEEIRNRQVLLTYDENPDAALETLRRELGPDLSHRQEVEGRVTDFPTRLDPAGIGRDVFKRQALRLSSGVDEFTDAGLEWIEPGDLDDHRRRALLERLTRPDTPDLVRLVLEDLEYRHSAGFGSMPIHQNLLPGQLDELAGKRTELLKETSFVNARIAKLHPNPDGDWANNPGEREAYLDELWRFVGTLTPAFNSLKTHVLYHRLDHDRRRGLHDRDRFLEYVRLPRQAPYVEPKYLRRRELRDCIADLGHDFRGVTLLEPVGDDEPLVREYLEHFFAGAGKIDPFDTYIRDTYLKEVFAVTKILLGAGDMEEWYSLLNDPTGVRELKERVDIEFVPTNKTRFRADEEVKLDVDVKNVRTLMVKVFEINTLNYFLANGSEVDTTVDLDGLVAGEEQSHDFDEPPLRRVRRTFAFPALRKPGVFVIEFIGGGKSSRALIRKGSLQTLERIGAAGHVFTLLDENNRVLRDATLWLEGHEYRPGKDGVITVPFTARPGPQKILLRHGDLATVASFHHLSEEVTFTAGLYVDRESLLKRKQAQLLVRPSLSIHGGPVSLSLIEKTRLVIESTDRNQVKATKEIPGFELRADRESVYTFQVPEDLAEISFAVTGEVKVLSGNDKIQVADRRTVFLNRIDATDAVDDMHLSRGAGGYALFLLGKSGEARPDKPVTLRFRHRGFTSEVEASLQTDEAGRIALGALDEIVSLAAVSPSGASSEWRLAGDACQYPATLHARAGETVSVPVMNSPALPGNKQGGGNRGDASPGRHAFSLLEVRDGTTVRDHFDALVVKDGYLLLEGLPAGDFDLLLKEQEVRIDIRVTAGDRHRDWILGENRRLETRNRKPMQIDRVEIGEDKIRIHVAGASRTARVHVIGTRFKPALSMHSELRLRGVPEPRLVETVKAESDYVSGRDIGDEYRYILERRRAVKFPGNMLSRPGLLLNPWAVRKTETGFDEAREGTAYGGARASAAMPCAEPPPPPLEREADMSAFANLDFLEHPSALAVNLRPDPNGEVVVERKSMAHVCEIHVLAVDPLNTVYRGIPLAEVTTPHRDLRLRFGLDPEKHFTEKKQVTALKKGSALEIADITTSEIEVFDTLQRVYNLYATLSGDDHLDTFGFILRWPHLEREEKNRLYSEYACHELHFFLAKKDPDYFRSVVSPYLRNKKDKTFMDRYLLGEDLSGCLKPWAFGRLNAVERILLGRRVEGESDAGKRHVDDRFELLPPDIEGDNHLFDTALKGSALETEDGLGMEEAGARVMASMAEKCMDLAPMTEARGMAAPKKKARRDAKKEEMEDLFEADEGEAYEYEEEDRDEEEDDLEAREGLRQFYRKLDKTEEWAENNYYKLPIEEQGPDLVEINAFWRDFAHHDGSGPFLSPNLARAANNFTEMMCALAVLDLPFEAEKPEVTYETEKMKLEAGAPAVVYHKEIKPAADASRKVPVLVSQNFFRADDRTRFEDGETVDKYVTDEFLVHTVYLCQVVLTNPTSSGQKLDLLLQIPRGALPVQNGFFTRGVHIRLESYATHSLEYAFYFPAPGSYPHYPVHVARNEEMIASAPPATLKVVRRLSRIDKTSWAYVSQNGEPEEVHRFMRDHNLDRLELEKIAWRMGDRSFYGKTLKLLAGRRVYNHALWSYSLKHGDVLNLRETLLHEDAFLERCGSWLESPLLAIDPVERGWFEHFEYAPLVNARAHALGGRHKILNDRFAWQFRRFLDVLCHKPRLTDDDRLAVAYSLLLQDRIEEGLEAFARVDVGNIPAKIQYDYLKAFKNFYSELPEAARAIAGRYADFPVDRWRKLFQNVIAQLDEAEGRGMQVVDEGDQAQRQSKLAASEPGFEFSVENMAVAVDYQNLKECRVNYYLMDIELLFSRQPFMQGQSEQFGFIAPNRSELVRLDQGATEFSFDLPEDFRRANLIVEIVGQAIRKSQAYFAHELLAQVIENYGHVRVTHKGDDKPLPKVYVKVYGRMKGGEVRFYKDGYTDIRGRFDYVSLNTDELDRVERFALLIVSESHGAVIREANPPKR